jgi:hypothetical protein
MKRSYLVIILVMAVSIGTLAQKKPPASQDPPPGRVHNVDEGLAMISSPLLSTLPMVSPGVTTQTAKDCFISSDLAAMTQLQKSFQAQDDIGVRELASQNRIAQIEGGTAMRIIEIDGDKELIAKVKLMMEHYEQANEEMVRACGGQRSIECRFPLAPVVIKQPLI